MAPSRWDDEDEDSTPPSSPPAPAAARRGKFDDEEDDSDVLDSWDKAEDSEEEREKAKAAAAAKAEAEAAAKANHKSRSQRIEEKRQANLRRRQEEDELTSSDDEDEADKRARLRKTEQEADLKHAEDLFGGIGISNARATTRKPVNITNPADPTQVLELSSLKIFNPHTRDQFNDLRDTLAPLVAANASKAHYVLFMQEFAKQLLKDLPSDQVKKVATVLTTMSNEKMREEKAAEKGGKKTKAAKTKSTLNAARDTTSKADTTLYDDDGLDDGDFM